MAYYKNGNLEKALVEFEKITTNSRCRLGSGDIYARSFYMMGKIHEELKNQIKAIEHYETFLDLWKNANPGLPEVEDAKKRLAVLKKSP